MKSNRLGLALLVVGGLMLITRLTPGNVFVELVWLAGYVLLARFMWRALRGCATSSWPAARNPPASRAPTERGPA